MYIDIDTIIKAANLVAALGILVGGIITVYKILERDKEQSEVIAAMRKEQTLICYCLKGALEGLIESGCNGPCKDALTRLNKHLNKAAHDGERPE